MQCSSAPRGGPPPIGQQLSPAPHSDVSWQMRSAGHVAAHDVPGPVPQHACPGQSSGPSHAIAGPVHGIDAA
jgi:hypothetical protein